MAKAENTELIWLQGALTAQGYMLELLLGAKVADLKSPVDQIERMRAALQKQIRFDMQVPPMTDPTADHLAIQKAAALHLDDMLDRIRTQFENSKPA